MIKRSKPRTIQQMVKEGDLIETVRLRQTFKINKNGSLTPVRNDYIDANGKVLK